MCPELCKELDAYILQNSHENTVSTGNVKGYRIPAVRHQQSKEEGPGTGTPQGRTHQGRTHQGRTPQITMGQNWEHKKLALRITDPPPLAYHSLVIQFGLLIFPITGLTV